MGQHYKKRWSHRYGLESLVQHRKSNYEGMSKIKGKLRSSMNSNDQIVGRKNVFQ